jgi:hypothetical protein
MAYSRWSTSMWYIFWCDGALPGKNHEMLAVWHTQDPNYSPEEGGTDPKFPYTVVKKTLKSGDYAGLLNFPWALKDEDKTILERCFKRFIQDVDSEYMRRGS